ncbi:hypothetical protein BCY76_000210 [Nesterenkonia sp. PF2B19]|nr:hypothetical protein BCY76_000210 [Nesterenkonia sp. PF2B19]
MLRRSPGSVHSVAGLTGAEGTGGGPAPHPRRTTLSMQLDILGPIRVCHEDRSPVVLTGLQGLLLAMLVAARGRPVPTDRLLDAMWGDNPCPRAAHRLQTHVHRLRRTLGGPDVLQAVGGGYVLQVPPGATDVERFENLIDEAAVTADADPRRAQELLGQACGLWRGRPFDGQTGAGLSIEAQRLDGLRLTARERLNAARLACREPEAVIEEVPSLIAEHPLRERLYELLMAAHALQGRPAEALEVHRQARHRLAEELGLDVGPGLRRLQEQVLRGGAPAPETFLTPRRSPAPAAGAPAAGVSAAGGSVTDVSVTGSASGRAATSGAVPPPAQLPAPPRGFHGREELLARLDELLGAAPAGASEAAPGDAAGSGSWHSREAAAPARPHWLCTGPTGLSPTSPTGASTPICGASVRRLPWILLACSHGSSSRWVWTPPVFRPLAQRDPHSCAH